MYIIKYRCLSTLADPEGGGNPVRPPPLTVADLLFFYAPNAKNSRFSLASLAIYLQPYFNRNMAQNNMLKITPPHPLTKSTPHKVKFWICHWALMEIDGLRDNGDKPL